MCETCGCGQPDDFTIHNREHTHDHSHETDHDHAHHHHEYEHAHEHEHDGLKHSHSHSHPEKKVINLEMDILSENNKMAERNRGYFEGKNVACFNLVSSPGSGKTTILEQTIKALDPSRKIFVIEGDQQTTRDADRIEKAGAPAIQINTGSGCHLDARMVSLAMKKLEITNDSLLFIENVGNLVCPALFDLGELKRVVVISVTEGDDKALKYPYMFLSSNLCIVNKTDLLPYVDFNPDELMKNAHQVNPEMEFIMMSAKTGEGMSEWIQWIGNLTHQV